MTGLPQKTASLVLLALLLPSAAPAQDDDALAALEAARRAQELAPRNPDVLLVVGRLLVKVGAAQEALRTFAAVRAIDPKNLDAHLGAAYVLRDVGRHDEAVALLEEGRARGIDDPKLGEELGLLLLAVERPGDARSLAQEALAANPRHGGLKLVVGLALAANPDRRPEASAWLEEALALGAPGPGKIRLELATLLLEAGRATDAVVHLREAERLLPGTPEVYYRLGTALRATGDVDGARAALRRYQELSRQSDTADWDAKKIGTELNEIQALANQDRLPEALERVEALLLANPREDRALSLKGKVLFSMRKLEEAHAAVVAAREIMPSRVEHHYLEGLFLTYLRRVDEAETALRRALALDATRGEAHELLGRLLAHKGAFEEAAEHFQAAIDHGVDTEDLRRAYDEVLKNLGQS